MQGGRERARNSRARLYVAGARARLRSKAAFLLGLQRSLRAGICDTRNSRPCQAGRFLHSRRGSSHSQRSEGRSRAARVQSVLAAVPRTSARSRKDARAPLQASQVRLPIKLRRRALHCQCVLHLEV